ncbi:hypothetical protein GMLC_44000 [Geomonas limicola]|uniref:Hemerythrin-like domain-containing protein n=1 Tax=Geomonas limicola TaxID=2740186 RepID=A0A6V8NE39_9BACT|nr:hypothetical protein [Geomonas limicola]GFO70821.1 hypothetical protein GMLC_44000 [Geomonas limicola]
MEQHGQQRGDHGYGYDSRFLRVIAVIDDAVRDAEGGRLHLVENRLKHLLVNIIEHARAEYDAMRGTNYPDTAEHEEDHVRICKAIAGLCRRWSGTTDTLHDLYDLRSIVFRHIGTHDHALGEHLMGMVSSSVVRCTLVPQTGP